jgi:polyisoprenoid-binding protein YceI
MVLVLAGPVHSAPAIWIVDPTKSSLGWVVEISGQKVAGRFKSFDAVIAFDPADLANSSAKVTIEMSGPESGDATRDVMLTKPDWFASADHPRAVYQTTGFIAKGGNAYEAKGTLTLKGVTKDVALPFTLTISGDTAVAKGQTTLARHAFNIGQGKDFETDKPVALNVTVMVNVTATRAK